MGMTQLAAAMMNEKWGTADIKWEPWNVYPLSLLFTAVMSVMSHAMLTGCCSAVRCDCWSAVVGGASSALLLIMLLLVVSAAAFALLTLPLPLPAAAACSLLLLAAVLGKSRLLFTFIT